MVEFEVDASMVEEAFRKAPQALYRRSRLALRDMLGDFTRTIKSDQFSGFAGSGGPSSNSLRTRTGALRNSIRSSRITGSSFDALQGSAFTASPYAPAHEFGATITPKRARYLKIPLPELLTPSGAFSEAKASRAESDGTFVRRSKRNPREAVVYWNRGRGRAVPIYALKKSVRLPGGRLRFFDTWDSLRNLRTRRLSLAVSRALEDATG